MGIPHSSNKKNFQVQPYSNENHAVEDFLDKKLPVKEFNEIHVATLVGRKMSQDLYGKISSANKMNAIIRPDLER